MKTIAFIPVRGGSKSIPLKNIKNFCGKPLVYWTIKAAVDTKSIDKVIVATDSDEIESVVQELLLPKVSIYRRNPENAKDTSSTESVILEYLENTSVSSFDNLVLIQATSPLLQSEDLEKGFKLIEEYDSVLSVVRSKRFFWDEEGKPVNYDLFNRPRRQDFDGLLMENGAFYINSISNILKFRNRLSGKIGLVEMPEFTAYEIDEEEDWVIVESLMRRFNNKSSKKKIKLFVTDVDGVLTDAGMYYSEKGDEMKKFNTHDGMAFQLLREQNIKTAIITSENTKIVENRAKKLKVDYLFQGRKYGGKLDSVKEICKIENIDLSEVAYIGDDINCFDLLSAVGTSACPSNATKKIKEIYGILQMTKKGGEGVVREFVETIVLLS